MPKGIPNKRYTPEFKQMVVETMREECLRHHRTIVSAAFVLRNGSFRFLVKSFPGRLENIQDTSQSCAKLSFIFRLTKLILSNIS